MENRKIEEYDVMRVILTFLVVVGHSAYLNMPFGYGGVDYTSVDCLGNVLTTNFYFYLYKLIGIIYFFHMPAFFFLSGSVFCIGMTNNKYFNLEMLVKNKIKRLIFPAVVAGVFWMVPLKYIGHGYSDSKNLPYAMFNGIILGQGTGHLWYLYTLFWIFLLAYLIIKYVIKDNKLGIIILLLMLGSLYSVIDIYFPGGNNISYYLEFFLCGYFFEENRKKIFSNEKRYIFVFALALIIAVCSFHYTGTSITTGKIIQDWEKTFGIIACTVILYIGSHYCVFLLKKNTMYKFLKKHCMNVYLLHDPLNYIILALAAKCVGIINYQINWNTVGIVLAVVRILGTISISLILSILINKIKIENKKIVILYSLVEIICMFLILFFNMQGISVKSTIYQP